MHLRCRTWYALPCPSGSAYGCGGGELVLVEGINILACTLILITGGFSQSLVHVKLQGRIFAFSCSFTDNAMFVTGGSTRHFLKPEDKPLAFEFIPSLVFASIDMLCCHRQTIIRPVHEHVL